MKQSCVGAFARAARFIALAAVAIGIGAGSLYAQSSGKIEGRVRDQAGAPIANAQVTIVGTAFATLTNNNGYYFFNNVPAGEVTVRAAFVGYQRAEVRGINVLAGQTLTQDIQLEQTAFQIDSVVVIAATQPLVPRDEVTTKQRLDGDFVSQLPADRITEVLALQPGVVASTNGQRINIRGGREDEAATYVDGVPVSPGYRGNPFVGSDGSSIEVGTNAFEQASVTTGASSAEFGNAQSGIIQIETRSGTSAFRGSVGVETDAVFGNTAGPGFNRIQASLGGPLMENLTFFVSGVLEGRQSQEVGKNAEDQPIFVQAGVDTTVAVPTAFAVNADTSFVNISNFAVFTGTCDEFTGSSNPDIANNYGAECQGIRLPSSSRSTYQLGGKLNYTYGSGSRLFLSAQQSRGQTRAFSGFGNSYGVLYNPQDLFANTDWSTVVTLGWTQNLARSAERALALDAAISYQKDRAITGPLTRQSEIDSRSPWGGFMVGGLDYLFDFDNFPVNDELINNFRLNTPGSRRSPFDLENTAQYATVDEFRNNAYGLPGFEEAGGPVGRMNLYDESRIVGRANLDWQVDRYNRLKLGGEFTRYDITSYSHSLTSQAFPDIFHEKPIRYDVFVEDRLDLGDVVLVGGLRYDYYHSRASRPEDFPRISSMPGFDPADPTALFVEDDSHSYLSPHIQVSFPVTDRTNFRLSYAHAVQAPDFGLILGGINTDRAITNTNHVFGSDLDFGKTIIFELGIRHAFSDDMVLDLSAYNKDNLSNAAGRLVSKFDPVIGANTDIRVITNADFGNTRGIDVRLDRRIGRFFNGVLAYTFQSAKNTGSDPFTYINFGSRIINQISGGNQPPPQAIFPTADSRPHNLTGSFALTFPSDFQEGTTLGAILGNVGITALFRYSSGEAYTKCPDETGNESVFSGQVCANLFEGDFFGAREPSFKQLDMRFTKSFGLRGLDLTAYLDARNILNFTNVVTVFTTTNDIVNAAEQDENFRSDSASFANEARENSLYNAGNGSIDLTFGGAAASGCGSWANEAGSPSAPNCVYMIRAEERYGNGDHIFSLDEQRAASDALYFVNRGLEDFTATPRRLRLGLEVNF